MAADLGMEFNSTADAEGATEARAAMHCQPLSGYLKSITDPLGPSQILQNFEHALTWTTMSFSSDPGTAARQLCGSKTR